MTGFLMSARKHEGLTGERLGFDQGVQVKFRYGCEEFVEPVRSQIDGDVDVFRETWLAVTKHSLSADDHVGNVVIIETSTDPSEKF